MTYRVVTDYRAGMPKTAKDGKPYRLIACHWTAGATGYQGAVGTLAYMLSSAAQRNASYHELWSYESGNFTAIRIVDPRSCAHSLNPQQPPNGPYDPDAWVREALGANWWDPNQGVYAVSVAGAAAACTRYATDERFIKYAQRRIAEIRAEIPGLVGLAEHSRFQNNKADWGPELTPALGGHRFTSLPDTAAENPMTDEDCQRRIAYWKGLADRRAARIGDLKATVASIEAGLPTLAAKLRDLSDQINVALEEEPPA